MTSDASKGKKRHARQARPSNAKQQRNKETHEHTHEQTKKTN